MNLKKKKLEMLQTTPFKEANEVKKEKKQFKAPTFIRMMKEGQANMTLKTFTIISVITSLAGGVIYQYVFGSIILSVGMAIPLLTLLYFIFANNALMNKKINDIAQYKQFIEILEAELAVTNSTQEALKNTNKRRLNPEIAEVLSEAIKDVKMGESMSSVLTRASAQIKEPRLKMVFTILLINQSIGSSETINGLKMIKQDLDTLNSNVLDFKDKVGGSLSENLIFFVLELALPVAMEMYKPGYFSELMPLGVVVPIAIVVVMFMALFGQVIVHRKLEKTLGEI